MKLDIFNHVFPRKYYDRTLELAPSGKGLHKRVRAIYEGNARRLMKLS